MNIFTYETSLGPLSIVANDTFITHIFFNHKFKFPKTKVFENPLIKRAYSQINEYLNGQRNNFDIPLTLVETEFSEKVRKVIQDIPYGHYTSYKCICSSIGQPKVYRAVGHSVRSNRIAIIIPCHRVLGVSGKIIGFEDDTVINEALLELERKHMKKFDIA